MDQSFAEPGFNYSHNKTAFGVGTYDKGYAEIMYNYLIILLNPSVIKAPRRLGFYEDVLLSLSVQ